MRFFIIIVYFIQRFNLLNMTICNNLLREMIPKRTETRKVFRYYLDIIFRRIKNIGIKNILLGSAQFLSFSIIFIIEKELYIL